MEILIEGKWTTSATAAGVPVLSGAHFSPLIGAVHNGRVTFWSSLEQWRHGQCGDREYGGTWGNERPQVRDQRQP